MKNLKMKIFVTEDIRINPNTKRFGYTKNEDGTLFGLSKTGFRKTKITKEAFVNNPSFVYGRFYKRWGWLNVKDIVDVKYKPIGIPLNHVFRDDALLISYTTPISKIDKNGGNTTDNYTHDVVVYGNEILTILLALRDRFGWDISTIKEEMWEKCLTLKNVSSFSDDSYFDEVVKNREHFDSWFERD